MKPEHGQPVRVVECIYPDLVGQIGIYMAEDEHHSVEFASGITYYNDGIMVVEPITLPYSVVPDNKIIKGHDGALYRVAVEKVIP